MRSAWIWLCLSSLGLCVGTPLLVQNESSTLLIEALRSNGEIRKLTTQLLGALSDFEVSTGRRHEDARGRGLCFRLFCVRDGDLFCERICAFLGDNAAKLEIQRQEQEWNQAKV